jgi:carbamoyltransferase
MALHRAILGISAFYHDSAAALLVDGEVVAAAQEERFTRKKHDPSFPRHAIRFVLTDAGYDIHDLECIAFYEKPLIKFERLLQTYHAFAPRGLASFAVAMPVWIKEKLFMKDLLKKELSALGGPLPPLVFPEHHVSHAASAFYPSPFEDAAILTLDGVGEWATTTICKGLGSEIEIVKELQFPHSLGLLYSAVTYYCGFKVNSGEYKLMGLAPYGIRGNGMLDMKNRILENIVDVREDGSFLLNMDYFDFATGLTMCNNRKWERLLNLPRRLPESTITQGHMDLARAIQEITEEIVLKLAQSAKELTGSGNLVMAGGVALNCVANGKILRSKTFKNLWIQPASGDAGGSIGAAYAAWHIWKGQKRAAPPHDAMKGSLLGPCFCGPDIEKMARKYAAPFTKIRDRSGLYDSAVSHLVKGDVVGWFQGRMEFGPRALGNRSILGDPRDPLMQRKMNLKIKYREGFRPFAPSIPEERTADYFDLDRPSPYMLIVAQVKSHRLLPLPADVETLPLLDRLHCPRSDVPAITHVDCSSRVQSVSRSVNEIYWGLLDAFEKKTGCAVLVNTSFNVRGEPIVCTPGDAYRCFMRTGMDALYIEDYLFEKPAQPAWNEDDAWRETYGPD